MAMQQHHQRNSTRSCFTGLLRKILIPQIFVRIVRLDRDVSIYHRIFHHVALNVQLVEHRKRNQFEILHSFGIVSTSGRVEGTIEIVEPIVGTQHLVPRIGKESSQRSLGIRVHHHLLQRIGRSHLTLGLIWAGRPCSMFPADVSRNGLCTDLARLTTDRHEAGNGSRQISSRQMTVHESSPSAYRHHLHIGHGTIFLHQHTEGLDIRGLPFFANGIDHANPSTEVVDYLRHSQLTHQLQSHLLIQFPIWEEIETRSISISGLQVLLSNVIVLQRRSPFYGRELIDGPLTLGYRLCKCSHATESQQGDRCPSFPYSNHIVFVYMHQR